MKTIRITLRTVFGLSLLLFFFGCTIKVEGPGYSDKAKSDSLSKQLMEGFGGHDTTPHGVTLPDIK
jgi:hypothetical protein